MPLFVAKTYDNKIISVILANSMISALNYWETECISFDLVTNYYNNFPGKVIPIVTTERKMIMNASCTEEQECFVIK